MGRKNSMKPSLKKEKHPMEKLLRMDRIPHIWCPGCGIGNAVSAFAEAVQKLQYDLDELCVVSGIGCTGRAAGYIKTDSFHTTHGRGIAYATGVKLGNPELKVVVISGDGDLAAIGGNHLVHAARRNIDITVICVNNFIYAMTGGQVAPTTPNPAYTTTSPFGNFEAPVNIPRVVEAAGAVYVARWTALHMRRMKESIIEALNKPGFSFVEVIAPCAMYYSRINRLGDGLNMMKFYYDNSVIKHGEPTENLDIGYQEEIIIGKFIDRERPTFSESLKSWKEKHRNGGEGDEE